MSLASWSPVRGTPDFIDSTGTLIAVYKRTVKGHGDYWTFPTALAPKKRTYPRTVVVGGLFSGDLSRLQSRINAVLAA